MKEQKINNELGMKLRELRKELHLNQEMFADILGVAREELSRIENGKIQPDWLKRAIQLHKVLKSQGRDFDWLECSNNDNN